MADTGSGAVRDGRKPTEIVRKEIEELITQPLSDVKHHEKMKSLENIPVLDMAAYVNRSSKDRIEENKKNPKHPLIPGKPLAGFILYRLAYKKRAYKVVDMLKTRPQNMNTTPLVSIIVGRSWNLESEATKTKFAEWVKAEAAGHRLAFPDYKLKYKRRAKARKAPKLEEDEELDSTTETSAENIYMGPPTAKQELEATEAKGLPLSPALSRILSLETILAGIESGSVPQCYWPADGINE